MRSHTNWHLVDDETDNEERLSMLHPEIGEVYEVSLYYYEDTSVSFVLHDPKEEKYRGWMTAPHNPVQLLKMKRLLRSDHQVFVVVDRFCSDEARTGFVAVGTWFCANCETELWDKKGIHTPQISRF